MTKPKQIDWDALRTLTKERTGVASHYEAQRLMAESLGISYVHMTQLQCGKRQPTPMLRLLAAELLDEK